MGYRTEVLADDPLVWWHLDEASGTTFADSSGSGRPGAGSGSFTYGVAGGVVGNTALQFNGAERVLHTGDYGHGAAPFTIELWFRLTATTRERLLSLGTLLAVDHTTNGIGLILQNSTLSGSIGKPEGGGWQDGAWHYLAISYDGGGIIGVHVDDQIAAVSTVAGLLPASGDVTFRVGDRESSVLLGFSSPWNGGIDEVAFYATALSDARLTAHYEARIGMNAVSSGVAADGYIYDPDAYFNRIWAWYVALLYWRLGEATGAAIDVSQYDNHLDGTVAGTAERHLPGATGDGDGALGLRGGQLARAVDGAVDYVPATDFAFTVTCLFKTTQAGVVQLWDIGGALWVELEDGIVRVRSGNGVDTVTIPAVVPVAPANDGEWHQLVVNHDGATAAPTIAGFLDRDTFIASGTGPAGASPPAAAYDIRIGQVTAPSPGAATFQGELDEVAIFDYGLYQEEANDLWDLLMPPLIGGTAAADLVVDAIVVEDLTPDRFKHWLGGDPVLVYGGDGSFLRWLGGASMVELEPGLARDVLATGFVPHDLATDALVVAPAARDLVADALVITDGAEVIVDGHVAPVAGGRAFPRPPAARLFPGEPAERAQPRLP